MWWEFFGCLRDFDSPPHPVQGARGYINSACPHRGRIPRAGPNGVGWSAAGPDQRYASSVNPFGDDRNYADDEDDFDAADGP